MGPLHRRASTTAGRLVVRDPRLLGGVELDPDESVLGPDALERHRRPSCAGRSSTATVALKARLMDQRRVAGVGNLIADEVLWRASLAPHRRSGSLTPAEYRRLHRHLRRTLEELIGAGRIAPGRPHARARRRAVAARATGPSWSARRWGAAPPGGAPATSTDRRRAPTGRGAQSPISARTLSAWPSAFTWYQARCTLPSGADEEGRADHADRLLAVQGLLAPGPVALHHGMVGVGEQREPSPYFLRNAVVLLGAVGRDAEDRHPGPGEGPEVVVELARLLGAPRGVVGAGRSTRRPAVPAKSRSDTLLPSWSGSVKAGALSPGARRCLVVCLSSATAELLLVVGAPPWHRPGAAIFCRETRAAGARRYRAERAPRRRRPST